MPEVQIYRVYVSGVASTFGNFDSAMSYLRAEAIYNRIDNLAFQTSIVDLKEYEKEIAMQEERNDL